MKSLPPEIQKRLIWHPQSKHMPMEKPSIKEIVPIPNTCDVCNLTVTEHRKYIQYDPETGIKYMRCLGCKKVYNPNTKSMDLGYHTQPFFVFQFSELDK